MTSEEICGSTETTSGNPCEWKPGPSCPFHNTNKNIDTGRPTKLTYERQEGIASLIEEGRSINSAARIHNVSAATIYNWLDRGESEYKEGNENDFSDFFERITRAKGYGEEWYFNTVVEIAKEEGDHRFLASLMKQRYPDSWGETKTGVEATEINVTSEVVEVTESDSWAEN